MQNQLYPPTQKATPTFVGFDNVNGKVVATFVIGNTKRDIPYSEARKFAVATQAALVPKWFIGDSTHANHMAHAPANLHADQH